MHLIKANKVWELVNLPEGKKTVGCKWVFKHKLDVDGSIETQGPSCYQRLSAATRTRL